jgi:4'-phosphopantetheinyl transferase
LALSPDAEVGIDVEEIRDVEAEVAQNHFSPAELAALEILQGEEWLRGFYRCWTRKEAILKAEGVGLNLPLNSFDVSLSPAAPAKLLRVDPEAARLSSWTLHDLSPAEGPIAALAAQSAQATVACFRLAL